MKKYIKKLMEKKDLNFDETTQAMTMMLNNQATPVQMASYITALAMKGATVDEVCASAMCLREHTEILDHDIDAIEIAGTGSTAGDSMCLPFPLLWLRPEDAK